MCMVGTGVDGSSYAEGCEELMKKMIEEHDVGHERVRSSGHWRDGAVRLAKSLLNENELHFYI